MYKLLLVEDEKGEIEQLDRMFQEYFNGDVEIIHATNGEDGISKYKQYHPDIIICDINLPKQNGLEMVESIRMIDDQIPIFILTGYNYFQYGMQAMQLHVEDFLLKPLSYSTLCNALDHLLQSIEEEKSTQRLIQKMKQIQPLLERDAIHAIVQNKKEEEINHLLSLLNITCDCAFCVATPYSKELETIHQQVIVDIKKLGYDVLHAGFYEFQVIYIFSKGYIDEKQRFTLSKCISTSYQNHEYMLGTIETGIMNFYRSFQEGFAYGNHTKKLQYRFYNDKIVELDMKQYQNDLMNVFSKLDNILLEKTEKSFMLQIQYLDPIRKKQMLVLCQKMINQAAGFYVEQKLDSFKNVYDMLKIMKEDFAPYIAQSKQGKQEVIVQKILRYISINYGRSITLQNVSDYVEMTPFYVSRILSESTGSNFTEILTKCRIKMAEKMLKERKMSIHEVAKKCGFMNQNYFSKVFKKIIGVTPSDYQKEMEV